MLRKCRVLNLDSPCVRVDDSYCHPPDRHLTLSEQRWRMVAVLRLPILPGSSRSAKELCIPCGKSGSRTRPTPGGDATRSASLSGSVEFALVARCCACPPHRRLLRGRPRHWPPPARPQYPRRRPATALVACPPPFAPLVCPTTPVAHCYHRQRRRDSPPHLASSEIGEIRGWDSSPQRPKALPN